MSKNFAFVLAMVAGCSNNSPPFMPADLSGVGSGGDMAMQGGGGDMGMLSYTVSTIAAMRQGAPGLYELDNVVAIAVTPSTKSPHAYLQDAAGGDFSAIRSDCSSTSMTHPCTVAATVAGIAVGHSVTVKGTFIKSKQSSGGAENFYIDSITDNGAGTLPTPATLTLADVQQSSVMNATTAAPTNKAKWFQHVTVTAPGSLAMYDLSPAVFKYTGTSACPSQFGWAMAPTGTTGAAATLSCDASCSASPVGAACTQPATAAAVNPAEIYIGTDFYKGFTKSSDCKCFQMYSDTAVTSTSTTAKLGGILVYDTVYMSMPVQAYIYLAPLDNTNDVAF
jgi:hypothetical protein